jgi:hypothetical protein
VRRHPPPPLQCARADALPQGRPGTLRPRTCTVTARVGSPSRSSEVCSPCGQSVLNVVVRVGLAARPRPVRSQMLHRRLTRRPRRSLWRPTMAPSPESLPVG